MAIRYLDSYPADLIKLEKLALLLGQEPRLINLEEVEKLKRHVHYRMQV